LSPCPLGFDWLFLIIIEPRARRSWPKPQLAAPSQKLSLLVLGDANL
jgi:hypothetical protein